MRVLVCGGRDYKNRTLVFETLDNIVINHGPIDSIIHGNASGADTLAHVWALSRDITPIPVPADWQRHGLSAGPIRNRKMITDHNPDLVIAFPGGKGTKNMIDLARNASIEVIEVK